MVAVYGNLMVMGITIALFFATVCLGRRPPATPRKDGDGPTPQPIPHPTPRTQP